MSADLEYKREWNRRRRLANGQIPRAPRPFPFAPMLEAALERVPPDLTGFNRIGAAYALLGVDRFAARRWREVGLSAYDADRCACNLGMHPSEIFGYSWFSAEAVYA